MRPAHHDVHLLELWWQLLWELLDGLQVPHVQRVGVDRHLRHLKSIVILFLSCARGPSWQAAWLLAFC